MKNVTVRHNKNYDSVLINNNSVEAYKEAVEVAKKLDTTTEIRPTQKNLQSVYWAIQAIW